MEPELNLNTTVELYHVTLSVTRGETIITLPDASPNKFDIIPVGVNRDGYIRLRNAQGMVENQFWSVDAAAFLSREEILILQEDTAYKREIDSYINDEQG